MERYICIHGHFYQPPRENPWLETVEQQESAYPFHDWNERITAECYAPNGASRIVNDRGEIIQIVNNYSRISFNFGPTLLSWMKDNAQSVYRSILEADRVSQERFSGHGSALAQVYNHIILPLANERDRLTEIRWGIRDFESRFGRRPEGLWLSETAVDTLTLDLLAREGVKFTILSPYQAGRVRRVGSRAYRDVSGGRVDPTHPYLVKLPEGRSIAVFFYDGPISRAVAFEGLLHSGETFAHRLLSGFDGAREWPQIMHIATDGESYGHHHKNGDMALAYALHYIEENQLATLTNYGEYLERHPPDWEAQILDNTAWSCSHGVDRWRSDCGCNSGGRAGWNQQWRGPLRGALDWLRDELAPLCEDAGAGILKDAWAARDAYIDVVLDRGPESLERFFAAHAAHPLSARERTRVLKLMELQRHALLMYTSCGWFFDEVSGLETVQVIQYAGRVVQLARELFPAAGGRIERGFLERLAQARSNVPEHRDGAAIYEKWVRPAAVGLEQVGAHYAISSVFKPAQDDGAIFCYDVHNEDYDVVSSGRSKLAVGRARVCSRITQECEEITFAVLHFGDHNLNAAVRRYQGEEAYRSLVDDARAAFLRADMPDVIRTIDRHFNGTAYSLKSLFGDEQRRIMNLILNSTMGEVEAGFRTMYDHHAPLLRFMAETRMQKPKPLMLAAEFVLNASLRRAFEAETLDLRAIGSLLEQARAEQVTLDGAGLAYALERTLKRMMLELQEDPLDLDRLDVMIAAAGLVRSLPFTVNLWKVQNIYNEIRKNIYPAFESENDVARWVERFKELGRKLYIRVEAIQQEAAPPMMLALAS